MTKAKPKNKQVQIILWQVLVLNVFVAALKIAVGLLSGTLSIVADGFHSVVDGSSNIIGLIAMRIAQAPPDDDHPYGHHKAETLASLFIGILLVFAAYEILKSAANRLLTGSDPDVTFLSIGVMVFTIIINLLVTSYERHWGKKLKSEILLADSEHTRSDIGVSLSVIMGLVGVWLGWIWLDAAVGLAIAAIIGYSAFKILSQSANVLMDQATLPSDEIEQLALTMPQVESVERIRSRGQLDASYVDLHVRVKHDTPIDYAHSIAHAVQHKIKEAYPQTNDVTIHIEPAFVDHLEHPDISRQLKAIAHSVGGSAHEIWIHSINNCYFVALHLEVPPSLSLAQAHDLATEVEKRGKLVFPEINTITTHIEPMGEMTEDKNIPAHETIATLLERAKTITNGICNADACHDLHLWHEGDKLALTMHCTLPPTLPITEAHTISERIDESLRLQIPQLKRVVVHVEPPT